MPISSSPYLRLAGFVFGTIWIGFGINAIIRPAHGLTFFEWALPNTPSERALVESLMHVYGVRDIFMGAATYAAAFYGDRKALGWILTAGSLTAFADGWICLRAGKGEWNHWGYAPMIGLIGALLLGVFDSKTKSA